MNWTRLKRMPFFTKLFASFSLVLCVPMLLLGAVVYSTSVNNLKNEILQSEQAMCRQLSQEVSSFFTSVLRSSEKVIFDQALRAASPQEAQTRLADYVHMSDAFDQIFYAGPEDHCLSSLAPGNVSLPQVYALSDQELAYYNVYISSSRSKFAYFQSGDCAVYIRPVTGENATFIFVLNPQRLSALFNVTDNYLMRYAAAVLFDGRKQAVLSANTEDILPTGLSYANPGDLITFSEPVTGYEWSVSLYLPQSYINGKTHAAGLFLLMIAVFLLTLALTALVSMHYYHPIKQLYHLSAEDREAEDFASNELETISTALISNHQLAQEARLQKIILRENLLLRLLNGAYPSEAEITAQLNQLGIFQNFSRGAVMIIRYHQDSGQRVSHEALMNYIDTRYSRRDMAYAVETSSSDSVVMLLKLPREEASFLSAVVADIQLFVRHRIQLDTRISVGNSHALRHMSTSYLEACAALENAPADGEQTLFFSETEKQVIAAQASPELQKTLLLMVNAMKANNAALAESLFRKAEQMVDQPAWRFDAFRITEAVLNLTLAEKERFDSQAKEYQTLHQMLALSLSAPSYEEHGRLMAEVITAFMTLRNAYDAQRESSDREQILSWAEANVSHPNMSLDFLIDTFGFSPSYWSRFFSEQIGVSFNDWLWKQRLARAKALLKETSQPVKEIVQAVGYTDVSSFSRRFKADVGLTPGQWRNT